MTIGQRNVLLILLTVLLAGIPTLMALGVLPPLVSDPQWAGGDGIITETAGEIQAGYEPWFSPLFSPADLGIEPIMFGLQGLLGGLLAAGFLGYIIGRRNAQTGSDGTTERRNAMIVASIGVVVFIAFFFVRTELGELQAFLMALQGLAIGTLAFFIGYPMGRNSVRETREPTRVGVSA